MSGSRTGSHPLLSPYKIFDLVFIKAVTNLHPGVGRAGEIVDLPVQKDNFGFPIIYSSSIKGSLKSTLWNMDKHLARSLFGPDPEEDIEKFTSAIAILDAFMVAFPVRSLEGVYAFATSPMLLHRLNEYLMIAGISNEAVEKFSKITIKEGECYATSKATDFLKVKALGDGDIIIINEEIQVSCVKDDEINKLEKFIGVEEGRLILLNNNDALRAIERSLMRVTRIAIDRERKTVKRGALWTEEYVPLGSIFATVFLYSGAKLSESFLKRIEEEKHEELEEVKALRNVENVKKKLEELFERTKGYLIIGGNETIGKGIVKLEFKGR